MNIFLYYKITFTKNIFIKEGIDFDILSFFLVATKLCTVFVKNAGILSFVYFSNSIIRYIFDHLSENFNIIRY